MEAAQQPEIRNPFAPRNSFNQPPTSALSGLFGTPPIRLRLAASSAATIRHPRPDRSVHRRRSSQGQAAVDFLLLPLRRRIQGQPHSESGRVPPTRQPALPHSPRQEPVGEGAEH
jgi:hypothetical protein